MTGSLPIAAAGLAALLRGRAPPAGSATIAAVEQLRAAMPAVHSFSAGVAS